MAIALDLALARVQLANNPRYALGDGPDATNPARRLDRIRTLMAGVDIVIGHWHTFGCK
jgi:hypothetical protein